MKIRTTAAAIAALSLTALPATAGAHVTLHPNAVPQGAFVAVDVRVPNERDDASTTKVDVKFPPGFVFASYQPVAGWQAKVVFAKVAKPIEVFGEKHTEQVDRIVWTANQGGIAPGQFQAFPLSLGLPEQATGTLTFKALQTYSSGEVVRWIGPPSADEPAPRIAIGPTDMTVSDYGETPDPADLSAAPTGGSSGKGQTSPPADVDVSDKASKGLAIAALIVGALGLLAALIAVALRRRPTSG